MILGSQGRRAAGISGSGGDAEHVTLHPGGLIVSQAGYLWTDGIDPAGNLPLPMRDTRPAHELHRMLACLRRIEPGPRNYDGFLRYLTECRSAGNLRSN